MALRDLLSDSGQVATATVATTATPNAEMAGTVATVATVAVAKAKNSKTSISLSTPETLADPAAPCPACGSGQWWQLPGHAWHCRQCAPMSFDISRRATTLTLPRHKLATRPVPAHAALRPV